MNATLKNTSWQEVMVDILKPETPFDSIRTMSKNELKDFIKKNSYIFKVIKSGKYTKDEYLLSSKLVYARNLLRVY